MTTHNIVIPQQSIEIMDNLCHYHRAATILTNLSHLSENNPDDDFCLEVASNDLLELLAQDPNMRWGNCPLCTLLTEADEGVL